MRKRSTPRKKRYIGGRVLLVFCNLLGTLMLLATIASCLLLVVPQSKDYYVFHVISGSMTPEIPIGSLVYVQSVDPEEIQVDDIIAFQSGNSVITHRVVYHDTVEGEFTTKGDANPAEDENPVRYNALVGKVVRHYPHLGELLVVYSTTVGKIYVVLFAACGAMLNVLAGRLRARIKEREKALEAIEKRLREAEQKAPQSDAPTPPIRTEE